MAAVIFVCVQIRPYSFYWRMIVWVEMTQGRANKWTGLFPEHL